MRSCCLLKLTVTSKWCRPEDEVPVLVLEHDRHLFRGAWRANSRAASTPGSVLRKRDVEMVRARKALSRRPESARGGRRCAAHRRRERHSGSDRSWRCRKFRESIDPRCRKSQRGNSRRMPPKKVGGAERRVGGLLLPGAPEPRLRPLFKPQQQRVTVLSLALAEWPVTAEPYRSKTAPLPRSSILVRPHRFHPERVEKKWWRAPSTAPGSETLYVTRRLSP